MIANALGPVFLLILLGALLRRIDLPGVDYWPGIERLTYYIAFPALLIHRLALADFSNARFGLFMAVIGASLVLISALTWLLKRWISRSNADFTSVFQGAIRFNTYIGLAVASALYGNDGLVIAAIAVAIMIPLVNMLSVLSFALATEQGDVRPASVVRSMLTNPLIVACLAGIALNLSGAGLPGWPEEVLSRLGAAALPLGLLAVGAALRPGTFRQDRTAIMAATFLKFMVLPALMLAMATLAGLDKPSRQILLLLACLPTASSAYILSRQMGGNADLMANITSAQSLLAFAVMPLWLWYGEQL